MSTTVGSDIIVIGGGIADIGCAAMVAQHRSVTVLEMEAACGYHASSRSAAIYIPSYGGEIIQQLSAASEAYLDAPPDDLESHGFLSSRGELLIAFDGEEDTMERLLEGMPGIAELSIDEGIELVPILNRAPIRRLCIEPRARDIDADRLLQCWIKKLRRHGGRIHTDHRAGRIEHVNGMWCVHTANARFTAPVIVNAAGAWCDDVARLAGITPLGLQPCRRSAALLPAPGDHHLDHWPLFGAVTETWYAKPMAGKLMVSPADEDPVAPHDAFTDDMVLAEGLDRYQQAVTVPVTRVEHQWAGLRTFAPDRAPVAGFDRRAEGFFWLAGQGGYGIQTAPALSKFAAGLLSGQHSDDSIPGIAQALSPTRFLDRASPG